ncbi:MAG: alpha-2-macroglobulin [Bacteroidia bacterium]
MDFKRIFLFSFLGISILAGALTYKRPVVKPPTQYVFTKGSSYLQEWKKIDSLINKGLNKSALDLVISLYDKAKKETNAAQSVKALMYRMKLEAEMEEYSVEKAISFLKEEAASAKYPLQPVIHSVLADIYWQYYTNNRWKFYNRTQTVNFSNNDITTWDLTHLVDQCIKEYQISLRNTDSLQHTPIDLYDDVLDLHPDTRHFRPTLYDFVAHRAIDFFSADEPGITRPAYRFEVDKPLYLGTSETFINLKLESKDTLSMKFYALKDLQALLAFHQNDKDPASLVDADLKRLKLVRAHAAFENKDSLYFQSLQSLKFRLENKFLSSSCRAEVIYEIARWMYEQGEKYNPLSSDIHHWDKKEALNEYCKDAISTFPNSYGAKECEVLQGEILAKSMSINTERVNAPDKPFRSLLSWKNMKTVYMRIVKLDVDKFQKMNERFYGEDLIKQYQKLPAFKEWEVSVPDEEDYNQHRAEIEIQALPLGHYLILTGSDKNFSYKKQGISYTPVWISNISYADRRRNDGSIEFYVLHRQTGEALKGATAQLWIEKYNYLSRKYEWVRSDSYTCDENGYFHVPPTKDYRNFNVEFAYGADKFYLDNSYYQYAGYKEPKIKNPKTFYFTDREIYRPGQTVYFKGICLQSDGEQNEILKAHPVTVTFYDANSQKISSLDLISNEYGSITGSFTAPQGVMNGQMYIADGYGSKYFSVEEYKRPKFEVTVKPVSGAYRLDDSVTVMGIAKAYSGANIDGAAVRYRVVRSAIFPYWFYWYRGFYPQSPAVEITNGFTTTNDTGGYKLSFKAIPDHAMDKSWSPTYTYTVYADVTDLNGETHSNTGYVNIGYKAFNLSIYIPERVNKEEKQHFAVSTLNLNGQFEAAKGKIEIYKLKDPGRVFRKKQWERPDKFLMTKDAFYAAFPHDAFDEEDNMYKWEKGEKMMDVPFENTASNTGTILTPKMNYRTDTLRLKNIGQWTSGYYVMEAHTKDKFGEDIKDIKYFCIYSNQEKTVTIPEVDCFSILKSDGEPGEKAKIMIGSKEDVHVLFEIEYKNEIVKKEWINLNGQQKELEIPIEEKHRGGFAYHLVFVKDNRAYQHDGTIIVPWTNKHLDITFETFRDKLQPGENEEWKLKIKGPKGEKVAAEMIATLYDASLDAFRPNYWDFSIYNSYYSSMYWASGETFGPVASQLYADNWNPYISMPYRYYENLNWFGYSFGGYNYWGSRGYGGAPGHASNKSMAQTAAPSSPAEEKESTGEDNYRDSSKNSAKKDSGGDKLAMDEMDLPTGGVVSKVGGKSRLITEKSEDGDEHSGKDGKNLNSVKARSNFAETAFFFPTLSTDENGEVIVKFTVPEALTRWKMMGFAHTKDLKYGSIGNTLVTQKDLMVVPDAPRFLREGDAMSFTAKITSLADAKLTGTAQLQFFDALSMKPVDDKLLVKANSVQNFTVTKGSSIVLNWDIRIPEGLCAVTYKVVAKAGNFADGEEMALPVLTNRMLVTETMPLPVRSKQTKIFTFEKFMNQNNHSTTLRNHKLTLEFTANPAWYAVQALPYLMEYPYECAEQTFSRFYANSIASHIANSSPKIKSVFDSWKSQSPDALLSNLQKNQELKSLMLEETPWVLDAKDESERKKRVALLFDMNKMGNELSSALRKLQKMQVSNGGWPWFEGMPDDRYITQHIITGMGHLDHLGVKNIRTDNTTWNMVSNGVRYLDARIREDYQWILDHDKAHLNEDHIGSEQIQYLYARSYFKDIAIDSRNQKAFDYYKGQAQKYWLSKGRYMEGMIALALFRYDDKKIPADIMKSLKENSLNSEEMGMYWKENYDGFYWYQAPVESQALLIEAFDEVAKDQKSVDDMKVWLLKSKQTQDWKTTKATTEACYALLLRGTDWLATESNVEITMGSQVIDPKKMDDVKVEAGTGYFKKSWSGDDIKTDMGKVTLVKKDEGVSWGAVYWQYFEQLDKITPHETPLKLTKKLFLERNTASGPVIEPVTSSLTLKPGDKIKVRIELKVDRDMQYVHMKDMRASCFEPTNVISQYKWQDGLGYYESTRDASTNFFFSWLPKGNYVFEYPLMVTHNGNFSNGITSIQCMYAPEFASHSEGIRVNVGK